MKQYKKNIKATLLLKGALICFEPTPCYAGLWEATEGIVQSELRVNATDWGHFKKSSQYAHVKSSGLSDQDDIERELRASYATWAHTKEVLSSPAKKRGGAGHGHGGGGGDDVLTKLIRGDALTPADRKELHEALEEAIKDNMALQKSVRTLQAHVGHLEAELHRKDEILRDAAHASSTGGSHHGHGSRSGGGGHGGGVGAPAMTVVDVKGASIDTELNVRGLPGDTKIDTGSLRGLKGENLQGVINSFAGKIKVMGGTISGPMVYLQEAFQKVIDEAAGGAGSGSGGGGRPHGLRPAAGSPQALLMEALKGKGLSGLKKTSGPKKKSGAGLGAGAPSFAEEAAKARASRGSVDPKFLDLTRKYRALLMSKSIYGFMRFEVNTSEGRKVLTFPELEAEMARESGDAKKDLYSAVIKKLEDLDKKQSNKIFEQLQEQRTKKDWESAGRPNY